MLTGRLPFRIGGNFPREVYLKTITDIPALTAYAETIHQFTSAEIQYGEVTQLFDIDLAEKVGGPYHSTRFLLVIHMRNSDGVRYSTAIPAPLAELLETRRQMWALKQEPGQLITQAYAKLTGLSELQFDQGALVG